ncbi:ion channel [Methanolobus sp.]|jgi:voltage-gated potassium channel|uniref:ion channel n=1 Tax=Methanolobus sp. TaxID=1874737 RepID=UPI00258DD776|nr:ion channel [Methanolobus sp.]
MILVSGILTYFIEGNEYGFTSVFFGIYWSFTTALSLGYGDIVPQTDLGYAILFFLQALGLILIIGPFLILILEIIESFYCLLHTALKG